MRQIAFGRLARRDVVVDHIVAVALDVLRHRGQAQLQPRRGFHEQRQPPAGRVATVELAAGSRPDTGDVACVVVAKDRDAQCSHVFLERHVDDGAFRVAEPTVLRASHAQRDLAGQRRRVRFVGHVLQQATHGACAVQGALRAAQHLDVIQIEQRHVERRAGAAGIGAVGAEGDVVDVHTHRRNRLVTGGDAANADLAQPRAAGRLDVDAWLRAHVVAQ